MAQEAVKRTTLCFVFDRARHRLLMIEKKRGQGAGKWNVPGGKIQAGEDPAAAAVRECEEETGILPSGLKEVGLLEFYFPKSDSWSNICSVFTAEEFSGELIPSGEECNAHWVGLDAIPFEKMWSDDRLWVPILLSGRRFHRVYSFDENDHMENEEIKDP
jgi:8-oxo-dGTP diphosphatase